MKNKNWFWPDVSDLDGAKEAARYGMWCAVFVACVTAFVVLLTIIFGLSIMGTKPAALFDAILFAGIAFGLSKNSRIAAVAGFVLFVIEKIYMLVVTGNFLSVGVFGIIIGLGFLNSIRGTFAYWRLSGGTPPSPGARPLQL